MQVERNNNNKHTRQWPIVNSCLGYCSYAIGGRGDMSAKCMTIEKPWGDPRDIRIRIIKLWIWKTSNAYQLLIIIGPDIPLAPIVQRVDNAIHQTKHYLVNSVVCFANTYSLDGDLNNGLCYPVFEKLVPEPKK